MLNLVLVPLMRRKRPVATLIDEAVAITRTLPAEQERQAMALLLGMANAFLSRTNMDKLLEGLMSTTALRDLLEQRFAKVEETARQKGLQEGQLKGRQQGLQQGRQEGLVEAKRNDVLLVLTTKFGAPPPSLVERIAEIREISVLDRLLEGALREATIEAFTDTLP